MIRAAVQGKEIYNGQRRNIQYESQSFSLGPYVGLAPDRNATIDEMIDVLQMEQGRVLQDLRGTVQYPLYILGYDIRAEDSTRHFFKTSPDISPASPR